MTGLVTQLPGHVPEHAEVMQHQHRAADAVLPVPQGRGRQAHGVALAVRAAQPALLAEHHRAAAVETTFHGIGQQFAALQILHPQDLLHGAAAGLVQGEAGELFRHRIHVGHPTGHVGGDHAVGDGLQGGEQPVALAAECLLGEALGGDVVGDPQHAPATRRFIRHGLPVVQEAAPLHPAFQLHRLARQGPPQPLGHLRVGAVHLQGVHAHRLPGDKPQALQTLALGEHEIAVPVQGKQHHGRAGDGGTQLVFPLAQGALRGQALTDVQEGGKDLRLLAHPDGIDMHLRREGAAVLAPVGTLEAGGQVPFRVAVHPAHILAGGVQVEVGDVQSAHQLLVAVAEAGAGTAIGLDDAAMPVDQDHGIQGLLEDQPEAQVVVAGGHGSLWVSERPGAGSTLPVS